MDTNITVALIAFLGTVLTGLITLITFKVELRNKRITAERIAWLNKVREDYSIIMAAYECLIVGNCNEQEPKIDKAEYDKRMFEAEKAKYDLMSRLRTTKFEGNEYNYMLKEILKQMTFSNGDIKDHRLDKNIEKFKTYMNGMLEKEWDKSKKESE